MAAERCVAQVRQRYLLIARTAIDINSSTEHRLSDHTLVEQGKKMGKNAIPITPAVFMPLWSPLGVIQS